MFSGNVKDGVVSLSDGQATCGSTAVKGNEFDTMTFLSVPLAVDTNLTAVKPLSIPDIR